MKKDCNNISFDEIFAQRGEEITFFDIKIGETYICIYKNIHYYSFLFELVNISIVGKIHPKIYLGSNGDFFDYTNTPESYVGWDTEMFFYLATPDQIALLNSYKLD